MKLLHFDIISGIAGDMAVGALLHLESKRSEAVVLRRLEEALQAMGLRDVDVSLSQTAIHGIGAGSFKVGCSESSHVHRSWRDIRAMLEGARLEEGALGRALKIFERLAEAEALVHGKKPEEVVFHEVGAADSIADIVGCALALEVLSPEVITATPPLLGGGVTRSQHGPIPVPAPATLELLKGVPTRGLDVEAELTTPTGAAILVGQVDRFSSWPGMIINEIGYGTGTRSVEGRPNLLRVVMGEVEDARQGEEIMVEANIDDMNPEHFEHLMDRLLDAGAHDVWLQPIVMKKSRPAITVSFLCDESRLEDLETALFRESTTIGVRRIPVFRRKLARRQEQVQTPFGPVRLKVSGEGGEDWTVAPEYDDCRECARRHQVPIKEVFQAALAAWNKRTES